MKNFKVGDRIRATRNLYNITNLRNKWEGVIKHLDGGLITATTLKCEDGYYPNGFEFGELDPKYFELCKSENFNSLYEKLNGETR